MASNMYYVTNLFFTYVLIACDNSSNVPCVYTHPSIRANLIITLILDNNMNTTFYSNYYSILVFVFLYSLLVL